MDKKALFSAAEIDPNIATIDLHASHNIEDAIDQLEKELYFYYQDGAKYCQVVYGGGTGRLRKAVHKELEKNPMIDDFKEVHGGACVVLF